MEIFTNKARFADHTQQNYICSFLTCINSYVFAVYYALLLNYIHG